MALMTWATYRSSNKLQIGSKTSSAINFSMIRWKNVLISWWSVSAISMFTSCVISWRWVYGIGLSPDSISLNILFSNRANDSSDPLITFPRPELKSIWRRAETQQFDSLFVIPFKDTLISICSSSVSTSPSVINTRSWFMVGPSSL